MKAVITTIQPPTEAVKKLAERVDVIVVGDAKTPEGYNVGRFMPLKYQTSELGKLLPLNSYSRKNMGYILAAKESDVLYETDDDNTILPEWTPRQKRIKVIPLFGDRWINPYKWFTLDDVWPRGLPLSYHNAPYRCGEVEIEIDSPVQQCLVNYSPDVDSIWRMLNPGEFRFCRRESVSVDSWAPINSQNTWWFKEAFPLMYLPSYCTMRSTDIWRDAFPPSQ